MSLSSGTRFVVDSIIDIGRTLTTLAIQALRARFDQHRCLARPNIARLVWKLQPSCYHPRHRLKPPPELTQLIWPAS